VQQGLKNASSSSVDDGSQLLRFNSRDSTSSEFINSLNKNLSLNQDQPESGPGSFTSTATSSSGSNINKNEGEDEGVAEERSNATNNHETVEPEPSKPQRLSQEVESGNESAPEQLSRENSAIEFSHTESQPQKSSVTIDADNQYKVYFYDPWESSSESTLHCTGVADNSTSPQFAHTTCKRGLVELSATPVQCKVLSDDDSQGS
jgi:hypothetical protein